MTTTMPHSETTTSDSSKIEIEIETSLESIDDNDVVTTAAATDASTVVVVQIVDPNDVHQTNEDVVEGGAVVASTNDVVLTSNDVA